MASNSASGEDLHSVSSAAAAGASLSMVGVAAQARAETGALVGSDGGEGTAEDLLARARTVMRRILDNRGDPNPCHLHYLAAIVEHEENRYEQQVGHPCNNVSRSAHTIGRLVNLIRDDDDFFELVSTRFLVEGVYSTRLRAAAARLLYSCISCWMYPHDFEETVLNQIKDWVVEDIPTDGILSFASRNTQRKNSLDDDALDREILRTYSTGLLAVALAGGDVVEDVLTTGMVSKLMHYLRLHVLGDVGGDVLSSENRSTGGAGGLRGRDEAPRRVRAPLDISPLVEGRLADRAGLGMDKLVDDVFSVEMFTEPLHDLKGKRLDMESSTMENGSPLEVGGVLGTSGVGVRICDGIEESEDSINEDRRRRRDRREGKSRNVDWYGTSRIHRDEEAEEAGRAEPSRRRNELRERGIPRSRGKGRPIDVPAVDTASGLFQQNFLQSPGGKAVTPFHQVFRCGGNLSDSVMGVEKDPINRVSDADLGEASTGIDGNTRSLVLGTLDLSTVVREASSAAEKEARAAKAPAEAVMAAGDAAAELVRVAATEALGTLNDEAAAMTAAKAAALSVVEAGRTTSMNRDQASSGEAWLESPVMRKPSEHSCDLDTQRGDCKMDIEELTSQRQRFCVQCLEKMGEYLEVLGPVLHERGVDVCLALLQRRAKDSSSPKDMSTLSDVLKLICALAAHRKFAALFVDRGGVQELLATPRVPQTLTGISLCLFALASLQGVMERVCALPTTSVQEVVALALQLLGSNQDPARRNAALFFGAAFVFRAILDAFDNQDGLRKLLNVLGNAALLRSGGGSNTGSSSISGGTRSDRGSAAEVLTSSGKQIAYHTCVALRQYFRAHLLLVVESLRPCKGHRSGSRGTANTRAVYKPLDISSEAIESLVTQLQRDRKLGPAFVRCRWIALEKYMNYGGHTTLLELTQAAPGERYLNEIAQHALGVLQLVTLMPYTRKLVVGATLYNERSGMAVILEAASGAAFGEPEVIQAALLVLVNLVCPPPSLCSRPVPPLSTPAHGQNGYLGPQPGLGTGPGPLTGEGKGRAGKEVSSDRNAECPTGTPGGGNAAASAAVVGDRRISLGPGAGGSGLAAYMEQGYRGAREAVRSNNGIRVLLHLLYPRTVFPPIALDRIRALACRVLLGLARDDAIAHILTKLQVGKILSELLRDGGAGGRNASSSVSGEQARWQAELSRVALDLIAIVTNAGRASTVAASEAAAPTLRRIERAAIAAATPISYHSRELLQLIHEHLLGSGLLESANILMKEAHLTPLPSSVSTIALPYRGVVAESTTDELLWPTGRVSGGFLDTLPKQLIRDEEEGVNSALADGAARRRIPGLMALPVGPSKGASLKQGTGKKPQAAKDTKLVSGRGNDCSEAVHPAGAGRINGADLENLFRTPSRALSVKRKASDRESLAMSPSKRMAVADPFFPASSPSPFYTPGHSRLKSSFPLDSSFSTPTTPLVSSDGSQRGLISGSSEKVEAVSWPHEVSGGMELHSLQVLQSQCFTTPNQFQGQHLSTNSGLLPETRACSSERATLDSLVVQYLKHQHRQCPAPITTLPPLSLLHPHVCPEPSRALDAPLNTACRLASREIFPPYGGVHGRRRDRHFVYSRFRPWRTCRDDANVLTTATFLGRAAYLAAGSLGGDIRIFDSNSGNILEIHSCHTSPITLLQSAPRELASGVEVFTSHPAQLLLSSTAFDVRLWDSSAMGNGPLHTFDGCKAARFNHTGNQFGAIGIDTSQKEVLLYDVGSGKLEQRLSDSAVGVPRSHSQAVVHFSPSDILILWNGVLWDHRIPRAIHKFDQFTDYGGGGFHPAGNEVIINSEVWDLRSYKLLRSVPSLDQTVITFNATADVIYAHLRRTSDDVRAALHPRRSRHELFSAFRTMDAVDYTDIATTPVDRCVVDLATEATDSVIAVVGAEALVLDDIEAVVRLYEVGRRRPTDDDSDPDDGGDSEDDDESEVEDDEDEDVHDIGDDSGSNDDEDGSGDDEEDDADADFGGSSDDDVSDDGLAGGILELVSDGEDGHSRGVFSSGDESGDEFDGFDRMLQGML